MRVGTFGRSFIGGATGAALVVGASVALAGTGVGGIFNLGQSNSVNETSTLTGTKNGPELTVMNSNTGSSSTPLSLRAASGKPPLTVNSNTRVPSLNADTVDGYHASWMSRIGMSALNPLSNDPGQTSYSNLERVTVVAPQDGFVRVDGSLTFNDLFSGTPCHYCRIAIRLRDEATGQFSAYTFATLGLENGVRDIQTLTQSWVFPVTKGTRSFTLNAEVGVQTGSTASGPPQLYDYKMIGQYLPYGYAGGGTGLEPPQEPFKIRAKRANKR